MKESFDLRLANSVSDVNGEWEVAHGRLKQGNPLAFFLRKRRGRR